MADVLPPAPETPEEGGGNVWAGARGSSPHHPFPPPPHCSKWGVPSYPLPRSIGYPARRLWPLSERRRCSLAMGTSRWAGAEYPGTCSPALMASGEGELRGGSLLFRPAPSRLEAVTSRVSANRMQRCFPPPSSVLELASTGKRGCAPCCGRDGTRNVSGVRAAP